MFDYNNEFIIYGMNDYLLKNNFGVLNIYGNTFAYITSNLHPLAFSKDDIKKGTIIENYLTDHEYLKLQNFNVISKIINSDEKVDINLFNTKDIQKSKVYKFFPKN